MAVALREKPRDSGPYSEVGNFGLHISAARALTPANAIPRQLSDQVFRIIVDDILKRKWGLEFSSTSLELPTKSTLPFKGITDAIPLARDQELENAYGKVGSWDSLRSSRAGREAEIVFWATKGQKGIDWLIERLRSETGNESLDSAARVLSKLGAQSLPSILRTLNFQPSPEQAYSLLYAIARMKAIDERAQADIELLLRRYVSHPDPEVREAAIAATAVLPPSSALDVFRTALTYETDPDIIAEINEEISARNSE